MLHLRDLHNIAFDSSGYITKALIPICRPSHHVSLKVKSIVGLARTARRHAHRRVCSCMPARSPGCGKLQLSDTLLKIGNDELYQTLSLRPDVSQFSGVSCQRQALAESKDSLSTRPSSKRLHLRPLNEQASSGGVNMKTTALAQSLAAMCRQLQPEDILCL